MSKVQFGSMAIVLVGLYIAVVGLTSIELNSGDLIVTFAAIVIGFTNNYMKTLMGDFQPRVIADVRLITGAFFAALYLFAVHSASGFGLNTIMYPIVAGIFFWSSVMAVVSAVDKVHTNEAIVVTQLHILVTPVAAAVLLDEKYRYTTLLGSLIMLAGVVVFSRDGHLNPSSNLLIAFILEPLQRFPSVCQ